MALRKLVFSNHNKKSLAVSCLLGSVFLFSVVQVRAQQVTKLNLEQALQIAKTNNRLILKSLTDKQIAEEGIHEQKELRLPELEFHSSYSRITNLTEFQSGFLQGKKVTKTIPEMYDVSSALRMPLYAGNKINNTIKQAETVSEITTLKAEQTQNDVKLHVIASFLGFYKMMELQKIIDESLAEEKERLKEVNSFKNHGTVTKNEVLRAELQLSERELDAIANKKNMVIVLQELKTLLQLKEESVLEIDTTQILSDVKAIEEYDLVLKGAMNNEQMQIAQKEVEMSELQHKIVKANTLPVISLFGSYAFKYPNYMFFPPDPYLYSLGQVGVEATFNLSNLYKNKTRVRVASMKIENQKQEAEIVKDANADTVFRQYAQYQELIARIPVAEKALALAKENYRIVKLKYLNQLALSTEMIDADNALLEAKFKNSAAKIDVAMKYYELLHTANQLH